MSAPPLQSRRRILIEQLNRSQWHAYDDRQWSSGVGNFVEALNAALVEASLSGMAIAWQPLGCRAEIFVPASNGGIQL